MTNGGVLPWPMGGVTMANGECYHGQWGVLPWPMGSVTMANGECYHDQW